FYLVALGLMSFSFVVLSVLALDRMILRRLEAVSTTVEDVRRTHDLAMRVTVDGDEELGTLAQDVNDTFAAPSQTRTALQAANADLEARVAERTEALATTNTLLRQEVAERQLAQAELAQAHTQAVDALRLKTQILGNISHDARTPLSVIILRAE